MSAIAKTALADVIESRALTLLAVDCPVVHHFGPGVYMREVTLPAGSCIVGHHHRDAHMNIMLRGSLVLVDDDGSERHLVAPQTFTAPPGRKTAKVIEETVWLNIYPNVDECRDIDAIEARLFDKSAAFTSKEAELFARDRMLRQPERSDFLVFACEYARATGVDESGVREIAERDNDLVGFAAGDGVKVTVRASPIEGRGVFLSAPAVAGEVIGMARVSGKRTPLGRWTNHGHRPNAAFRILSNGDIETVALRAIAGCCGGSRGEEVTVDYRQAVALSGVHLTHSEST